MAKILDVQLKGGLIDLSIDNSTSTVTVTNSDPTRTALFNLVDASGAIVWSYQQAPGTADTIAIPTVDNNGNAIAWKFGTVTGKFGSSQGVISPGWQLTMVA